MVSETECNVVQVYDNCIAATATKGFLRTSDVWSQPNPHMNICLLILFAKWTVVVIHSVSELILSLTVGKICEQNQEEEEKKSDSAFSGIKSNQVSGQWKEAVILL